jgi:RNA polymerase sigma-70 factor (ECF subfamily)
VRRALRDLPRDQREAVVLRFFADLSYREIGLATGCPTQTAATRVRRGLERVAKDLEDR